VDLSIVVPCYNEAARLPATMERLGGHLHALRRPYEVILVDDGSSDRTLSFLQDAARHWRAAQVVALRSNRGKGRAIAEGVRVSRGDVVLYTDADLSTPIEELGRLEGALTEGADVAFGSRTVSRAERAPRPLHRRLMARTFNVVVQAILLPGFRDTQCGFKAFRGGVARELFADLRTDGFAFDVEILLKARRAGYRVEEVSVRWLDSGTSRISPLRHSLQMLRDVVRLRLRLGRAAAPASRTVGHDAAMNR
jgi:dolichyl-phosphate beta-glucosyltransferase